MKTTAALYAKFYAILKVAGNKTEGRFGGYSVVWNMILIVFEYRELLSRTINFVN